MNTSVTTVADYLTTPPTSPHRVRINFAASPDEPLAITGDPVGTAVGWLPLTRSDISRIEADIRRVQRGINGHTRNTAGYRIETPPAQGEYRASLEAELDRETRAEIEVWGPPGRVVEPGELLTEAVVREVNEETGLLVERIGPLGRSPGWGLAPHCSAGPAIRAVIGPSSR